MLLPPISSITSPFERKNRIQGVQDFENYMTQYPGAAPGGTGATGLSPTDATGWSKLLEKQQQYLTDKAELEGNNAPTIRFGGYGPGAAGGGGRVNDALGGLQRVVGVTGARGPSGALPGGDEADRGSLLDRVMYGRTDEGAISTLQRLGLLPQPPNPENEDLRDQAERVALRRATATPDQQATMANDVQDRLAIGAGQRYTFPDVAAQRNEEQGNLIRKIATQYLAPEQLKSEATHYTADQRFAGDQEAADARVYDAIMRLAGTQATAGARSDAAGTNTLADTFKIDPSNMSPEDQAALKALQDFIRSKQGIPSGAPAPGIR